MAKAKAENSTSDEIWFNDAVALLADGCGSTEPAERLLIRGLQNHLVPWSRIREDGTRVEGDVAFWSYKGAYLDVRRVENKASYCPLIEGACDVPSPSTIYGIKVSRAAALALLPAVAKKPTKAGKRKSTKPVGRPPDYDRDAIASVAENYIRDNGCPRTQVRLREKVEDACDAARPRIVVPAPTLFKDIVRPIWHRHRSKKSESRKLITDH